MFSFVFYVFYSSEMSRLPHSGILSSRVSFNLSKIESSLMRSTLTWNVCWCVGNKIQTWNDIWYQWIAVRCMLPLFISGYHVIWFCFDYAHTNYYNMILTIFFFTPQGLCWGVETNSSKSDLANESTPSIFTQGSSSWSENKPLSKVCFSANVVSGFIDWIERMN